MRESGSKATRNSVFTLSFFLFVSEINRVRLQLFHHKGNGRIPLDLPEPIGPVQTISEKLYVPVKEHPDVSIKHYISYLQTSTQSFICEADPLLPYMYPHGHITTQYYIQFNLTPAYMIGIYLHNFSFSAVGN